MGTKLPRKIGYVNDTSAFQLSDF